MQTARTLPRLAPGALLLLGLGFPCAGWSAGVERTFDVSPGDKLVVEAERASVSVANSAGTTARVEVRRGSDSEEEILDDYDIEISQEGGTLLVDIDARRPWRNLWSWGRRGLQVTIEVPSRFDARIETSGGSIQVSDLEGEVDAQTSGGSVKIEAISGPVRARTSGGSIRLARSSGDAELRSSGGSIALGEVEGNVRATTSGGSISIHRAGGLVTAETSGGSIKVEEAHGAVAATTSGGSIRAYISQQPQTDSRLSTSGGGITVVLGEGIAVDLDAEASGGRVSSAFDVETRGTAPSRSRLTGSINGGGPQLRLRTSGGGIRITKDS